ncbi:DUF1648 domain-containing protein [Paenibacillus cymbidii]|uniref:DUF1648 domain-containing protein n=1 Tax=Paenibacillus cymbidii TaxID=1639034 RepID=UPI0014368284|nr:DUF1648 domain-containing protein [Paenibacillus cymbidii]
MSNTPIPRARWYLLHLLVVALSALAAIVFWDRIPDPVPAHFGVSGQPDRYEAKSIGTVFLPNFIQLGLLLLFTFIDGIIRFAARSGALVAPGTPEAAAGRMNRSAIIMMMAISLPIVVLIGYLQATSLFGGSLGAAKWVAFLLPVIVIAGAIGLPIYLARGKGSVSGAEGEDRYWRGDIFYFNRDNPALLVPKRIGIGSTFNMAHPLSWIILGAILLLPIAFIVFAATRG